MIRLIADSRDRKYNFRQNFGGAMDIPDEFQFDSVLADYVQPAGDVKCVAIGVCDIAKDQDNVIYDFNDLFNRIPHNTLGANPRDGLSEAVKNGLKRADTGEIVKHWSSWWSTGNAQETISAMWLSKSSVAIWTNFYSGWLSADVMGEGQGASTGHFYEVKGVKRINGVKMFVIEAWIGRDLYMPFEVFDKETTRWGCGTAVLSTFLVDEKRTKTWIEAIIDWAKNFILALQEKKQTPLPPQEPVSVKPDAPQEVKKEPEIVKLWDTKENIRHSCRVICDEEGLAVSDKNDMVATIQAESGFNLTIKNLNGKWKNKLDENGNQIYDKQTGVPIREYVVLSTDWGLCQINDYWNIGAGKPFPSVDFVLNNPEKVVRWMCGEWKRGEFSKQKWIAYKNGSYKNYL